LHVETDIAIIQAGRERVFAVSSRRVGGAQNGVSVELGDQRLGVPGGGSGVGVLVEG
jgi:hypothetical protein